MNAHEARGNWGSRIGFILAAAGSAVGLGNIWGFPMQVGKGGGAIFVLLYLICVFVICFPIMIAELALGRSSGKSPIEAFAVTKPNTPWWVVGALGVMAGVGILSFYSVIAGWSCVNEGSIREFQRKTTQWDMGKNFDRTGGFGPWMASADELAVGGRGLKIESRLNGQVMQSDNTNNMMFPVAETLVYLTQGMTLEPGDVLVTGTPSGVGHARKPPIWMKQGDVIEIEIEGVGLLSNPIEDEK